MMTNGNLPLTDPQRSALIDFVRDGGGFIGVHCAALTLYDYPEFGEMLGGSFRMVRTPIQSTASAAPPAVPPPMVGQHNQEVLCGIGGLSPEDLALLQADEVV